MNNKIHYTIIFVAISLTLTTRPSLGRGGDHPSVIDAPFGVVGQYYQVGARPEDYKVIIEEATGHAFIRMPNGWKFMRKLDTAQLKTARAMWLSGVPQLSVGDEAPVSVDNVSNSQLISRE
jgi:hypothetical protein